MVPPWVHPNDRPNPDPEAGSRTGCSPGSLDDPEELASQSATREDLLETSQKLLADRTRCEGGAVRGGAEVDHGANDAVITAVGLYSDEED